MFKFRIDDLKELNTFLSVNSSNEYVDTFCYGNKIRLVSNSTELFACLILDAQSSENQEDFSFRLNTKLLKSLDSGNSVVLEDSEDKIKMSFYGENDTFYFRSVFTKQAVFDTTYSDKLRLLGRGTTNAFESDSIFDLAKIAKIFHSFVCVDSGVASVILDSGPRIYKKVSYHDTFALTGEVFSDLRKCNHVFANVGSYIISERGNLSLIARKVIAYENTEYALLHSVKYGAKCIAEINLARLIVFFKKTRIKIDRIHVCVAEKSVKVEGFNSEFTIPVFIKVMELAEGASMSDFNIPSAVLFGFFSSLSEYQFILKQKKSFTQLEQGDITIVW